MTKTVIENAHGCSDIWALARLMRLEEMANPDADFDALMDEMGGVLQTIDAANAWDIDPA